ncbi:MAG: outer membrane beta-barrel protein, partial [Methylocella sp.]
LASAGAMALSGAALAAEPAPAPPPPQWTGFYVGGNAGGTWSNNNSVTTVTGNGASSPGFDPLGIASAGLATTSVPVKIDGFIGGGQWGDNYQFANRWVGGFESDFQGITGGNRTTTLFSQATADVAGVGFSTNQNLTASKRLDWLATDRVRLGYLITPTFLAYGTGGVAYGTTRASVAIAQTVSPGFSSGASFGNFDKTLAGWTAGGGVEWLFYPNWSLKVEYLYYDLGHVNFTMSPLVNSVAGVPVTVGAGSGSTRFNGNIVRAGLNYHIDLSMLAPIFAHF